MGPSSPRFGVHVSVAGGLHRAFDEARRLGCDCFQIFVRNQRQWDARPLTPEQIAAFHTAAGASPPAPIIAHASYLLNLASADRALLRRSIAALTDELDRCEALGVEGLVIHPGAAGDSSVRAALRRIGASVNRVLGRAPQGRCRILLETTAGQGTSLGRSIEEIAQILDCVECRDRIGVCLDTCHLYAAGYDIRSRDGYANLMTLLESAIGLASVRCLHANDSAKPLSSRVDRHAHIGEGELGKGAFAHFITDPRWAGLPMILETPKGTDARGQEWDRINLRRLRSLARRAKVRHLEAPAAGPTATEEVLRRPVDGAIAPRPTREFATGRLFSRDIRRRGC